VAPPVAPSGPGIAPDPRVPRALQSRRAAPFPVPCSRPMRSPHPVRTPVRPPLPLKDLLAAVERRRGTRLELVCWRLDVDEARAAPAWELALQQGLIERRGEDPFTGRAMFALTERGDAARRRLGRRPRRG